MPQPRTPKKARINSKLIADLDLDEWDFPPTTRTKTIRYEDVLNRGLIALATITS
jgi:hypothetical protein